MFYYQKKKRKESKKNTERKKAGCTFQKCQLYEKQRKVIGNVPK